MAAAMLKDVQLMLTKNPGATVFVTGHSLGAAVALHAAVDIIRTTGAHVHLYNYGEPRVGNPAFAAWAAATLTEGRQFRVTHARDPVPHLPPLDFGFIHTPHELWYDNNGNTTWRDCKDSSTAEDPTCSDSVLPIDVEDHLLYLGICTECSCTSAKHAEPGRTVKGSSLRSY
jgi:hypothetical protein